MNNLLTGLILALLTSVAFVQTTPTLPNGHYLVVLDQQYKDRGLNDYEFTLDNEKFLYQLNQQIEHFEMVWVDDTSFRVKGLTEPMHPTDFEKTLIAANTIFFRIVKQEKNNYYFILGEASDNYPVYSGKLIKTD